MIFVVEFEKDMANTSIFGIIIDKLYYKKKPYPIILFKIDKNSKVGFHHIILSLDLTVCL